LKTDRYDCVEDLLRDALQALKQRDEEVAAVQEGIDDMQSGRVRSLAEFDEEFRRRKRLS
jgi:predicted transcriptional regulator